MLWGAWIRKKQEDIMQPSYHFSLKRYRALFVTIIHDARGLPRRHFTRYSPAFPELSRKIGSFWMIWLCRLHWRQSLIRHLLYSIERRTTAMRLIPTPQPLIPLLRYAFMTTDAADMTTPRRHYPLRFHHRYATKRYAARRFYAALRCYFRRIHLLLMRIDYWACAW